jgi:hypothetical protein
LLRDRKEEIDGPNAKTWWVLPRLNSLWNPSLIGYNPSIDVRSREKPLVQYSLNRCFIGSPGTGKTSVAKLYGQILAEIGMLSNGEGKC